MQTNIPIGQVSIGQSDPTSEGPRSAVTCTIGRPGLDNPGFQIYTVSLVPSRVLFERMLHLDSKLDEV